MAVIKRPDTPLQETFKKSKFDSSLLSTLKPTKLTDAAIAKKLGMENYRLQVNVGKEAGLVVFHLHVHLMSVA